MNHNRDQYGEICPKGTIITFASWQQPPTVQLHLKPAQYEAIRTQHCKPRQLTMAGGP